MNAAAPLLPPLPAVTPENAFFWLGGEEGELRFRHCVECDHYLHPPTPYCPKCLSTEIDTQIVSGRATVLAKSINHHPWHPALPPPYCLAIVAIEEAPYVHLTTRIINCDPHAVTTGMKVTVQFQQAGPVWLPLFVPERG